MSVRAFRLWNFMGFTDTRWIRLRDLNLLFGRNATGKSALIRALLLLRQSLTSPATGDALTLYAEDGIDAGSFHDILHRPPPQRRSDSSPTTLGFGFQVDVEVALLKALFPEETDILSAAAWVSIRLDYGGVVEAITKSRQIAL